MTLGEIPLLKDEEEELNPFEWAQISAKHHQQTLKELAKLRLGASSEQDTIKKLQAQLDDFITTKNNTEKEMLEQFMQLLNEKKRKIRDQSRLLASAKIDENKAKAVTSAREATKPATESTKTRKTVAPRPSTRSSKRKATSKVPKAESESEAEEPEANNGEMDVDMDSEPGVATPDRLADEDTEDEQDQVVSIPERRTLPFTRAKSSRLSPQKTMTMTKSAAVAGDGDETEDEEL